MEEYQRTLHVLAEQIGPRPPTSAAEAEAAAYVNSRMRRSGLDVDVQTFRAVRTASLPYGLIYAAGAAAPLVYVYNRPAALALAVLALLCFTGEALSFPVLSSLLPKGQSQNVVGTRPPTNEPRQHLIVLAHIDSGRANLLFHPRLVRYHRLFFLLCFAALGALVVLLAIRWVSTALWLWYLQWIPAGYLAIAVVLLLHSELFLPQVPGANDNASGVAALLRLAERIENLQYTTLWLAATGCHESGMHGARQFLRQYPFPRDRTYVVNLDSVGHGQLALIVAEGMLVPRRTDPDLLELASQAEGADIAINGDPRTYHHGNTDALVALMRRFRAISVTALHKGRPAYWHWPSDTLENLQPELPDRAVRLVEGIARRVDRRAAAQEMT